MSCAIDRSAPSTDHAALSVDLLLAQPLIDRAAPSVDGFGVGRTHWTDWHDLSCTFYRASTVRVRWGTGKSELHARLWLVGCIRV